MAITIKESRTLDKLERNQCLTKISSKKITNKIKKLMDRIPCSNWEGTMHSVPYDTAWVSMLQTKEKTPLFPMTVEWLSQNQQIAGNWGSEGFICDSLLSTAAAVNALLKYKNYSSQVALGLEWLTTHLTAINDTDFIQMAGFEFLLPSLLNQIAQYDIEIVSQVKPLIYLQEQKLAKLPITKVLNAKTPKLFTLEFLASYQGDIPDLDHFIERNGSISSSPSATAWYYSLNQSKKQGEMVKYLKNVQHEDGGFPSLADYQLYNILFIMYPIVKIIGPQAYFKQVLEGQFLPYWSETGVGYSKHISLTDADDTVLGLHLLEQHGLINSENNHWRVMRYYEREDYFTTYPYEIMASNMVNLHVLDAYSENNHKERDRIIEKLIFYFERLLPEDTASLGGDKYHFSPYCQNSHGVLALSKEAPDLSERIVNWFWQEQQINGLWGSHPLQPTIEETAYAILALCYYHIHVEKVDLERLRSAIQYILAFDLDSPQPPLWLSKTAYTPIEVNDAHVLASLLAYKEAIRMR
ncbi:MAG: prenyltransferase/squalene oxidase repeat-containing protein [Candidatus Hodarchaeales archaeon]|jgi:hypothetical protein